MEIWAHTLLNPNEQIHVFSCPGNGRPNYGAVQPYVRRACVGDPSAPVIRNFVFSHPPGAVPHYDMLDDSQTPTQAPETTQPECETGWVVSGA